MAANSAESEANPACEANDRPSAFVVGIGGGSCSGKSTLAAALREALTPLSVRLVNMDTYMLREKGPHLTLSTGEHLPDNNHPESTDNALALAAIHSSRDQVVIVEGLMVLHLPQIVRILDMALFVETDAAIRTARRILRSHERQPDQSLEWIARYFLECAVPGHEAYVEPSRKSADFVVSGSDKSPRSVTLLAQMIRACVQV